MAVEAIESQRAKDLKNFLQASTILGIRHVSFAGLQFTRANQT
jgi:hypothetical protein